MSVGEISSIHQAYIQLSEKFKASWTFHQFLHGLYKTLLAEQPPFQFQFQPIYEQLKLVAADMGSANAPRLRGVIRALEQKLDTIDAALLVEDSKLSPSLLRRFFERMKGQDEKILFPLIKFYLLAPALDRETLDKVDFLFTKLAEASSEAGHAIADPETVRKLRGLLSTRPIPAADPAEIIGFRERIVGLAAQVERAASFEELSERGLLGTLRNVKQELGPLFLHPDVLLAVISANLVVKSAFARLYRAEEQRIQEDSARISELERALQTQADDNPRLASNLSEYKRAMEEFQQNVREDNVKHQDVVQLRSSMHELLRRFEDSFASGDELSLEDVFDDTHVSGRSASQTAVSGGMEDEDPVLRPYVEKILFAVDYIEASLPASAVVNSREVANLRLEAVEVEACRAIGGTGRRPATAVDRLVLSAAGLRVKIDEEARELLRLASTPASLPPMLAHAKQSIDRARALERRFDELVDDATYEATEVGPLRDLYRTRYRLVRGYTGLWLLYDKLSRLA